MPDMPCTPHTRPHTQTQTTVPRSPPPSPSSPSPLPQQAPPFPAAAAATSAGGRAGRPSARGGDDGAQGAGGAGWAGAGRVHAARQAGQQRDGQPEHTGEAGVHGGGWGVGGGGREMVVVAGRMGGCRRERVCGVRCLHRGWPPNAGRGGRGHPGRRRGGVVAGTFTLTVVVVGGGVLARGSRRSAAPLPLLTLPAACPPPLGAPRPAAGAQAGSHRQRRRLHRHLAARLGGLQEPAAAGAPNHRAALVGRQGYPAAGPLPPLQPGLRTHL